MGASGRRPGAPQKEAQNRPPKGPQNGPRFGAHFGPEAKGPEKAAWGGSRPEGPGRGAQESPKRARKEAKNRVILGHFGAPSGPQRQAPKERQSGEGQGPRAGTSGGQAPPTPPPEGGGRAARAKILIRQEGRAGPRMLEKGASKSPCPNCRGFPMLFFFFMWHIWAIGRGMVA